MVEIYYKAKMLVVYFRPTCETRLYRCVISAATLALIAYFTKMYIICNKTSMQISNAYFVHYAHIHGIHD